MIYLIFGIILLYLFVQSLVLGTLLSENAQQKDLSKPLKEWPKLSVLVAARNEEENITTCLRALSKLDYPKDQIEFLIGDDQSEDQTGQLIQNFCKEDPRFSYSLIEEQLGKAQKKANVLAQLAHKASGEFFLITDADIQVPTTWAKELVSSFDEKTGTVSGITVIRKQNFFSRMQHLDWLYFMGILFAFGRWRISSTAVGNNMAVRSKAYFETGGYENLPFSITEDFLLFKAILDKGWGWKQLCNEQSTNISEAARSMSQLMKQRKRWLIGGKGLPRLWKSILALFGSFQPMIILLAIFHPKEAVTLWFIRILLQSWILIYLSLQTKQKTSFASLIIYEFYSFFIALLTPVFLLLPGGKEWKGRKYEATNYA